MNTSLLAFRTISMMHNTNRMLHQSMEHSRRRRIKHREYEQNKEQDNERL